MEEARRVGKAGAEASVLRTLARDLVLPLNLFERGHMHSDQDMVTGVRLTRAAVRSPFQLEVVGFPRQTGLARVRVVIDNAAPVVEFFRRVAVGTTAEQARRLFDRQLLPEERAALGGGGPVDPTRLKIRVEGDVAMLTAPLVVGVPRWVDLADDNAVWIGLERSRGFGRGVLAKAFPPTPNGGASVSLPEPQATSDL
jgi:hypothetical protein